MKPVLVFDIETIPDVAGLRRLNELPPELSDDEVAELAFQQRRAKGGSDFLPLHLQKVAVVGCVFRDDQGFRVKTLGQPDDPEAALLAGFFKTIERYTPLAEKHGLHLQHYEMRDLHIHDLRRTLGSWLASSGTSLPIIGRVLNHKTPEATKVYARLSVAPVRSAMEEATAAMRKIGEQ